MVLFNQGSPEAGSTVQEVAAAALLTRKPEALSFDARALHSVALRNIKELKNAKERVGRCEVLEATRRRSVTVLPLRLLPRRRCLEASHRSWREGGSST